MHTPILRRIFGIRGLFAELSSHPELLGGVPEIDIYVSEARSDDGATAMAAVKASSFRPRTRVLSVPRSQNIFRWASNEVWDRWKEGLDRGPPWASRVSGDGPICGVRKSLDGFFRSDMREIRLEI